MINERLKALEGLIHHEYSNISGLAIFIGVQIEYEYYAEGYSQDSTVHVASVTKSILSLLIGIAIEQGSIKSIDDKVLDYFPAYKLKIGEKTIQQLTIKHLLTMTAPYKFKSEPYTKVYSSDDWTVTVLDLLGGKGNIGEFKYTTVGIQILSGIVKNATNLPVLEFANKNLFEPLNIAVSQNIKIQGRDDYLDFLKKNVSSGWVIDPKGLNTGGWGLTLTARDMVKIGQLYLNKGTWNNKKIVSSKWIKDSVTKHSSLENKAYGFLWWVIDDVTGTYAAIGDGGNIIYVSSINKMVVAITSQFKPRAKDRIELIKKHIDPIFNCSG
ncbi:serine hydrolase [Vibrio tapetis subsp. quintayensis]|uniref:serine hydrolase domain-containing protein n=1 Tax=Vibrio tapetis TaxID=52443 RepID=UPI0025B45F58|nr:serine hydrolase [Vibrio tapetis]MDN3680498.1 serine hydrolase [Vibrio tapetis subsp. quintayensis]